jgi:tetratricopeptide (TPR) repeat protein
VRATAVRIPIVGSAARPTGRREDVKRLVIGFVFAVVSVSVAFAAPATSAPAGQPAAGAPPASSGNPPVRYDWQGNHKKAQAALRARDYKTAIILFTEILNSGRLPKSWKGPTHYMRGKAYRSTRQYDLAIADYLAAVAADPKMDGAYYELGATYQAINQHAKAVDAFGKAIALKSNNADYYYSRCVSYSWLGNYKAAINDCEAATRLRPRDADMLGALGRLYEDAGQKQRAIETYKLALSINPNQPEAREGLKQLTK